MKTIHSTWASTGGRSMPHEPSGDGSTILSVNGVLVKAWLSNGHWYAFCPACGKWVRLDKPIVGSIHFCK